MCAAVCVCVCMRLSATPCSVIDAVSMIESISNGFPATLPCQESNGDINMDLDVDVRDIVMVSRMPKWTMRCCVATLTIA